MNPVKLEAGILLIAEPFLKDPGFMRSVVLLCRHSAEDGSFGFVLNNHFCKDVNDLVPNISPIAFPVFIGGPVKPNTLHYIHQYPEYIRESTKIIENTYWGGNFEDLKNALWEKKLSSNKIKFFTGYSGWSSGQLESELNEKSWLTVAGTENIIFETPEQDVWKNSLFQLGGEFKMLAHYPTDPQLN